MPTAARHPIELALGVGLLLLPVALAVVTFPTCVERQSMARLAAQEAGAHGRARVGRHGRRGGCDGPRQPSGVNHGLPASDVALAVDCTLARGGAVTAAATVGSPRPSSPASG